jgi:hypothetical protein
MSIKRNKFKTYTTNNKKKFNTTVHHTTGTKIYKT